MNIQDTDSVIPGGRYHNRRDYMGFPSLGRSDLMYDRIKPLPVVGLQLDGSLFEQIAKKDFLQYAPYHTFTYVIKCLRESALDRSLTGPITDRDSALQFHAVQGYLEDRRRHHDLRRDAGLEPG